jgi:ADP-heptose:LPS heptosyltransferase
MSHRIQYNPYIHVSGAYLSLVNAAFSLKTDEPLLKEIINMDQVSLPAFIPDQADVDRVSKLINIQSSRKYIILNPNASDLIPLRKWDLQNFTGLIELINAEFDNCSIIITGTDEEKKFAAQLIQSTSAVNVTDLTGKTSFNDLMTLYTLCDVLITNDSGPGHFSTLTGIHKIILFGPETPVLYGPIGNRVHVIYKKLACSPCVNAMNHRFSACRNNLCMQSITTDEVFKTLCTILKN